MRDVLQKKKRKTRTKEKTNGLSSLHAAFTLKFIVTHNSTVSSFPSLVTGLRVETPQRGAEGEITAGIRVDGGVCMLLGLDMSMSLGVSAS